MNKPTFSASAMMDMRLSGMDNESIAKKLGCTYATVLRTIGKQPDFMTATSKILAGKSRREKTSAIQSNRAIMAKAQQYSKLRKMVSDVDYKIEALLAEKHRLEVQMSDYKECYILANTVGGLTRIA